MDMHAPFPLQLLGQSMRWHASPVKPVSHLHLPVFLSQVPLFEHSVGTWASSSSAAISLHALPVGQVPEREEPSASEKCRDMPSQQQRVSTAYAASNPLL